MTELIEYLRALLLFKAVPQYNEVYLTDTAANLEKLASLYSNDRIMASEERLHAALVELRGTMRPRITAELCLLDLCRREGSALASLPARVESLEWQLATGALAPAYGQTQAPAYNAASPAAAALAQQSAPKLAPPPKKVPERLLYTGPEEQFVEPDEGVPSPDELAQLSAAPPAAVQPVPRAGAPVTPAAPARTTSVPAVSAPPAAPAVAPVTSAANAASIEEFGGDYAAGEDFWQQTLELVRSEKKMSMFSCARGGRVYSFANDILVVAFKSAFQSQRMNKPDFHEYFEGVLLRVARRPIRLQCEPETELKKHTGSGTKPQPTAPKVASAPKAQSIAQNELPENLQKAMHAFGGTITKVN